MQKLLGIGDWGLGWGWGLGIGPNPQSPIPNPQSPFVDICRKYKINLSIYINYPVLLFFTLVIDRNKLQHYIIKLETNILILN